MLIYSIGGNIPGYSLTYFLPTIVKSFQYSNIQTQLHAVPPFATAYVYSILICFISARVGHRLGFIIFSLLLALSGVGILFNVHAAHGSHLHAEYAATFLIAMGLFGALPVALCWYIMNLRGHMERGLGTAWMIGFGNAGGIVATFSFQSKNTPIYHMGYSIITFGLCLTAGSAIAYSIGCYAENRRMAKTGKAGFRKIAI